MAIIMNSPLSGSRTSNLLHQYCSSKPSPSDPATPLSTDANIVPNNEQLCLNTRRAGSLDCHAEV